MARKVIWSNEAIADLGTIVRYVARDNRAAAMALGEAILDRTRRLADFPHAGRTVPEGRDPTLRELIVEPYRVIYEVKNDADIVDVLRVWHAARGRPEIEDKASH